VILSGINIFGKDNLQSSKDMIFAILKQINITQTDLLRKITEL